MPGQFVMYESAVKVSHARHAGASIAPTGNYNFSRNVNAVPLAAVEFPHAASEYSIVFVGDKDTVTPVAVLGLRDGENVFLSDDGKWEAKFVPAFLRRYPFAFSQSGDRLELCIDESFPGLNAEGRGSRLFADNGASTPYVDHVLKFLQEYQVQFARSQQFGAHLQNLGLLEPMQARVTMEPGRALSLGGFMAVSREKLKALPGDTMAELARTDELELIYLHLNSMGHFERLRERMQTVGSDRIAGAAGVAAPKQRAEAP
jgi:hypothetical protein